MQALFGLTTTSVTRENSEGKSPHGSTGANISLDNSEAVYALLMKINRQKALLLAPVIAYTLVLMLVGVIGNPLAIFIYGWRWRHSTTRIFLFWLACLDLTNCLITMPTEIYIMVNFFYFPHADLCRVSRFLTYVTNNSTSCVFVAIAIDRYIRICHPHKKTISIFGAQLACGLSFCVGIGVSLPALLLYGRKLVPLTHSEINGSFSGVICEVKSEMDGTPYPIGFVISLSCAFFICVIILIVLYSMIGRVMLRRRRRRSVLTKVRVSYLISTLGEGETLKEATCEFSATYTESNVDGSNNAFDCIGSRQNKKSNTPPKSTLMLFAITAVYVISFLPFLVVMTVRQRVGPHFYPSLSPAQQVIVNLFARSYLINNCANSIVYSMCNSRYRNQLSNLFPISSQRRLGLTRDLSGTTCGLTS